MIRSQISKDHTNKIVLTLHCCLKFLMLKIYNHVNFSFRSFWHNNLTLINKLIKLPGTFTGTKKIQWLDLSNNQITILSEEGFKELTGLLELHLNKNSIKTIDLYAFKGLDQLQILDLSYNYISVVNDSMKNLTSMEYLNLRHNDLHQLNGDEFFQMIQLSKLDLSENQLDDRFSLNMTYDNQLIELILNHNQIQRLWFNLSHLDNLQILDLSYNNISVMNVTRYGRLVSLENLNLAYNNLKVWKTGQFTGLPQLHDLNCSHNLIETVAITGVFTLPTLHTLDLSSNVISDLDYFSLLSRLPSLSYIKLSNNLLSCDLEKEMENSFSEDNFKYELYDDVAGEKKCVKKPLLPAHRLLRESDSFVSTPSDRLTASDIVMFILISLVIAAISVLAYVQYLFYKGVQISLPGRAESNLRLINSEPEPREEEFVNALS